MLLKLYYNPGQQVFDDPVNQGFDEALTLLTVLIEKGIECERINTETMSKEELGKAYSEAWVPSVRKGYKGYRIRQIFGSRRHSGTFFGKGMPALLVYEEEGRPPVDVYPHEEFGRIITIKEFLQGLQQA